jgi:hypothetical protein
VGKRRSGEFKEGGNVTGREPGHAKEEGDRYASGNSQTPEPPAEGNDQRAAGPSGDGAATTSNRPGADDTARNPTNQPQRRNAAATRNARRPEANAKARPEHLNPHQENDSAAARRDTTAAETATEHLHKQSGRRPAADREKAAN